jgi:hypothetical protein
MGKLFCWLAASSAATSTHPPGARASPNLSGSWRKYLLKYLLIFIILALSIQIANTFNLQSSFFNLHSSLIPDP